MLLGTSGGIGFVASVAIGKVTGNSARGGGGKVSFFCRFEAEGTVLTSVLDLFFEDAPPLVFTILEV